MWSTLWGFPRVLGGYKSILIYQPNKGNTKFQNIYQQGPLGMYVFKKNSKLGKGIIKALQNYQSGKGKSKWQTFTLLVS